MPIEKLWRGKNVCREHPVAADAWHSRRIPESAQFVADAAATHI